jgi:hypothetical protein
VRHPDSFPSPCGRHGGGAAVARPATVARNGVIRPPPIALLSVSCWLLWIGGGALAPQAAAETWGCGAPPNSHAVQRRRCAPLLATYGPLARRSALGGILITPRARTGR